MVVKPLADPEAQPSLARVEWRTRRKFTESGLLGLRKFLGVYDWTDLYYSRGPDQKLEWLECVVNGTMDAYCPKESIKVKLNEKFYANYNLL